jgi:hypothetical protein
MRLTRESNADTMSAPTNSQWRHSMNKTVAALIVAAGLGAVAVGHTTAATVKVTICHIPPGNPANRHTIEVGQPAVNAHLAHGDYIGACGAGGGGGIGPSLPPAGQS